ncbi:hypothetical protein CB1_001838004 [Camelus ferus]|nr:hypothetical protein CB1_001838004 [Camelus ferus]
MSKSSFNFELCHLVDEVLIFLDVAGRFFLPVLSLILQETTGVSAVSSFHSEVLFHSMHVELQKLSPFQSCTLQLLPELHDVLGQVVALHLPVIDKQVHLLAQPWHLLFIEVPKCDFSSP